MTSGQVILITGTSRGIGKFLTQHYCQKNFQVIGVSRTAPDWKAPSNYTHHILDISNEKEVADLFKTLRTSFKRLDVLINNAAINPKIAPAMLMSMTDLVQTMSVNFFGTFLMSREAAKLMMRNQFGRIINLSSMAVKHEVAGEAAYTSSKAAVVAFTRVFSKEVYAQGITCNVVAPAAIETQMMAAVDKNALADVLKRNAIPEIGEFADVAAATDWLILKESQKITGQTIYLGGA
ncbi:MAG: SDR family NAD(P)-dependent oxidoreductase [Bdellovibrionales bacterium]